MRIKRPLCFPFCYQSVIGCNGDSFAYGPDSASVNTGHMHAPYLDEAIGTFLATFNDVLKLMTTTL